MLTLHTMIQLCLSADASQYGLGAMISCEFPDGEEAYHFCVTIT